MNISGRKRYKMITFGEAYVPTLQILQEQEEFLAGKIASSVSSLEDDLQEVISFTNSYLTQFLTAIKSAAKKKLTDDLHQELEKTFPELPTNFTFSSEEEIKHILFHILSYPLLNYSGNVSEMHVTTEFLSEYLRDRSTLGSVLLTGDLLCSDGTVLVSANYFNNLRFPIVYLILVIRLLNETIENLKKQL